MKSVFLVINLTFLSSHHLRRDPEGLPASNYLVIQTPGDNLASVTQGPGAVPGPMPPASSAASQVRAGAQVQNLKKRAVSAHVSKVLNHKLLWGLSHWPIFVEEFTAEKMSYDGK